MSISPASALRLVVDDPDDAALAAALLADGAVVAHGFGNIYALTARGDAATVERVNALKGRPPGQVGSVTAPAGQELSVFDLDALPAGLDPGLVGRLVGALSRLGPIGFRGPAAAHVPAHLTAPSHGGVSAQVILPGSRCPSNHFLGLASLVVGSDPLFVTSANRSRHVTGATEEPTHWSAGPLREELGDVPGLVVLEHADEREARLRFMHHEPMSTTILGLDHVSVVDGVVHVPVERHGSLSIGVVRWVLASLGLGVTVEESAQVRLQPRRYADTRVVV